LNWRFYARFFLVALILSIVVAIWEFFTKRQKRPELKCNDLFGEAKILRSQGKRRKAIRTLKRAKKLPVNNKLRAALCFEMAQIFVELNEWGLATAAAEEEVVLLTAVVPENTADWDRLVGRSMMEYQEILKGPNAPRRRIFAILRRHREGDSAGATRELFERLVQTSPEDRELRIWIQLGLLEIYFELHQYGNCVLLFADVNVELADFEEGPLRSYLESKLASCYNEAKLAANSQIEEILAYANAALRKEDFDSAGRQAQYALMVANEYRFHTLPSAGRAHAVNGYAHLGMHRNEVALQSLNRAAQILRHFRKDLEWHEWDNLCDAIWRCKHPNR
jgi:hypothetical protein